VYRQQDSSGELRAPKLYRTMQQQRPMDLHPLARGKEVLLYKCTDFLGVTVSRVLGSHNTAALCSQLGLCSTSLSSRECCPGASQAVLRSIYQRHVYKLLAILIASRHLHCMQQARHLPILQPRHCCCANRKWLCLQQSI
jgi:hypothetical protein